MGDAILYQTKNTGRMEVRDGFFRQNRRFSPLISGMTHPYFLPLAAATFHAR
jgi:hypothetical protein